MSKQNKKTVLGNMRKLKPQNLYIFLILVVLLLILVVLLFFFSFMAKNLRMTGHDVLESGLPPPDIIDDGYWEITHTTDNDYTPYIANLKYKKTTLGLIPNNGICPKDITKQLYDRDNNLILDDENKSITLKCESAKCDGKNCYSITLTDAQAVNINDYVKIGKESTTYEWVDSILYIYDTDTYDVNGFEIEIYTDDTKLTSPDVKWIEDNPTDNKIVFYPNLSNIIYPLDSVSFKVNNFIIPKARVSINPYYSVISNWVLDFSGFENKNIIENKTIEPVYGEEDEFGFKEILGYMVSYYGLILDLDPVMELIYDGASDIVFNNITEGSSQGARIDTPVLFMDFNKAPEVLDDTTYINYSDDYVQDNSVWNNYGDAGNLKDDGMWVDGNFSGGLEFDEVDDYVGFDEIELSTFPDGWSTFAWVKYYKCNEVLCGIFGDYVLQIKTTNDLLSSYDGGSKFSTDAIIEGVWTHVGAVCDNSTDIITFYINGTNSSSQSYNCDFSSYNRVQHIGYTSAGLYHFDGIIDEVKIYNRTITQGEIDCLYVNNTILNSTGLVLNMHLDETTGTNALNSANTSNNGTLINYMTHNPTYNSSCTAFTGSGGCYEFDGGDDFIDVGAGIDIETKSTISFWFKTSASFEQVIVGGACIANDKKSNIIIQSDGKIELSNTNLITSNTYNDGNWYHLVITYDSGIPTYYIDGVNVSTEVGASERTSHETVIGARFYANIYSLNFHGSLDNLQIWDRALSSDEISTLYSDYSSIGKYSKSGNFTSLVFYNSTSVYWNTTFDMANSSGQGIDLTDANLVSYWKLDEDYLDSKGTNHGTATGTNNATGLSSDAMLFDDVDDYIEIPQIYTNNFPNGWGAFVWVKYYDNDETSGSIFGGWLMRIETSTNKLFSYDGVSGKYSTVALTEGVWTHVGVVCDNSTDILTYYINGVNDSSQSYNCDFGEGYRIRYIGTYGGGVSFFNGIIDEALVYNDTLSNAEVMDLYKTGLSQHADTNISLKTRTATSYNLTDTGLVSQWSFNADNNGTDEMGLNDGACDSSANCPTWGEDYGVVGGGYDFDGGDDYVNVTSLNSLSGTISGTVTGWFKLNEDLPAVYSNFMLGHIDSVGNSPGLAVGFTLDHELYAYMGNTTTLKSIKTSFEPNIWYHFAATTESKLYINGVLDKTVAAGSLNWSSFTGDSLKIGREGEYAPRYFNGSIDEVRIYNRSLSASEVEDLYELGEKYILWNAWSGEENMQDGIANMTTDFGNFFQFETLFTTNDTEVSPYLLNHTVEFGEEATPPQVTIVSPTATTYTSSSISFEIRTNENSTCDYSVDSGVTNTSMTANSTGTGHTASQTLSNKAWTANFYCRDIAGNLNNTEHVSFTVSVSGNGGVSTTGGGGGIAPSLKFSIDVSSIQRTLALNRIEFGQVKVTNNGDVSAIFTAYVEVLEDIITLEQTSLTLEPGQSGIFEFKLTPPDNTGIYTGKIIIKSGTALKEILTTINVRTEKILFDITLHIPKSMRTIKTSKLLRVQINLLQMGLKEKVDVTLNYVIKDFDGIVHLSESETLAVLDQKSISKEFHTEELAPGDYVLGTELIYADGVAIASSQFKVEDKLGVGIKEIFIVVLIIIASAILVVILLIVRRYRRVLKDVKRRV